MGTLWQWSLFGNALRDWAYAALAAASALVAFRAVQRLLLPRLLRVALKTGTGLDELIGGVLARTRPWLLAALALYAGSLALTLPAGVAAWALPSP